MCFDQSSLSKVSRVCSSDWVCSARFLSCLILCVVLWVLVAVWLKWACFLCFAFCSVDFVLLVAVLTLVSDHYISNHLLF